MSTRTSAKAATTKRLVVVPMETEVEEVEVVEEEEEVEEEVASDSLVAKVKNKFMW